MADNYAEDLMMMLRGADSTAREEKKVFCTIITIITITTQYSRCRYGVREVENVISIKHASTIKEVLVWKAASNTVLPAEYPKLYLPLLQIISAVGSRQLVYTDLVGDCVYEVFCNRL